MRPWRIPPSRPLPVGAALGKTGGGPTGLRRAKAEERSSAASSRPATALRSPSSRLRRLDDDGASELLLSFLGAPRCTRPALRCSRAAAVSGAARGGERARRLRELPPEATAIVPRGRSELAACGTAGVVEFAAEPPPPAREAPTPMLLLLAAAASNAAAACCIS